MTFSFLRGLAAHNDKTWFEAHRAEYQAGYVAPALSLVAALGPRLQRIVKGVAFEPRINGSLFRVNRDVRFSKDKSPYKPHIDLWFWMGQRKGWDSPGFFFRMHHDRVMLGAGMHGFMGPLLERYRRAVVDDKKGAALLAALDAVKGYDIGGRSRKRVPRGYDEAHPRASLLLHEGLYAGVDVPLPAAARSAAFVDWCVDHCARVAPIALWLRDIA